MNQLISIPCALMFVFLSQGSIQQKQQMLRGLRIQPMYAIPCERDVVCHARNRLALMLSLYGGITFGGSKLEVHVFCKHCLLIGHSCELYVN